jgi:hypothetical protein
MRQNTYSRNEGVLVYYIHTYIHAYIHTLHYITLHYTTLHYIHVLHSMAQKLVKNDHVE